MKLLQLDVYTRNFRLLGIVAIAISVATWAVDIAGLVPPCPYCRTQRSVIGLLGVLLLLPDPRHWVSRFAATVLGALGVVVGANQNFRRGWEEMSAGTFSLGADWYVHPFPLSSAALIIMVGIVLLMYTPNPSRLGASGSQ